MSLVSLLKRSIKAARKILWKGKPGLDPAYAPIDLLAWRRPFTFHVLARGLQPSYAVVSHKLYLQQHPAFPRARIAA